MTVASLRPAAVARAWPAACPTSATCRCARGAGSPRRCATSASRSRSATSTRPCSPGCRRTRRAACCRCCTASPGEDGALREVLELLGVPYVGSRPAACRVAFDKPVAKTVVARAGIRTPRGVTLPAETFRELGAAAVMDGLVVGSGCRCSSSRPRAARRSGCSVVRERRRAARGDGQRLRLRRHRARRDLRRRRRGGRAGRRHRRRSAAPCRSSRSRPTAASTTTPPATPRGRRSSRSRRSSTTSSPPSAPGSRSPRTRRWGCATCPAPTSSSTRTGRCGSSRSTSRPG